MLAGRSNGRIGKAFTLIELLVVIAIIALLLSIVVPSLRMAREVAKRTICATNLNSLGQGVYLYANDNQDFLPESRYVGGSSNIWRYSPWVSYNLFYIDRTPGLSPKQRVTETFGLGHLFMLDMIQAGEVYYCPSSPLRVGTGGGAISFRYEHYSRGGGDFPWNNDPSGWATNLVRSSYNYVPQSSRNRVQISTSSGSGTFPANAVRADELGSAHTMATDLLHNLDLLPHKRGTRQPSGVNVLFSDGSVSFSNNPEAFDRELWEAEGRVSHDEYLFRTVLSRLR